MRKYNEATKKWTQIKSENHACIPKEKSEVHEMNYFDFTMITVLLQALGLSERRNVRESIVKGRQQNISKAFLDLSADIAEKHSENPDIIEIKKSAYGNETATKHSFRCARAKQYPVISSFSEIAKTNVSKTISGEQQLMRKLGDITIFSTTYLLKILSQLKIIVSDGTFKYRPQKTGQVKNKNNNTGLVTQKFF